LAFGVSADCQQSDAVFRIQGLRAPHQSESTPN
jgi:hypothetical protein